MLTLLSIPSNIVALIAIVSLLIARLHRRTGLVLIVISSALLVLAALGPIGNVLLTPLEERFPIGKFPSGNIQGIIVLGGSYDTVSHGYISTIVLKEDTEPMAVIPELASRYPGAKIIFSGGTDDPSERDEASIVKDYFISFGIAPGRIVTEGKSQTTHENAQFTANLLHPEPSSRWLLVTSGYHMPRSVGAFRKAGFHVIAFPVGLRTHGWHDMWRPESEAADNLRRMDIAVHEWVGLLYYKLKGYSDDWFAAPADAQGAGLSSAKN